MAESKSILSPDEKAVLSMRADEFNVALARGGSGDWSQYLEGLGGPVRMAVLTELAVIELGFRWENGEQPTLEEYVQRFPELGPPGSEPPALQEEIERCRDRAGVSAMATQHSKRIVVPEERVSAPEPEPETADDDPELRATRTVRSTGSQPVVSGVQGGEGLLGIAQNYELIRELGRGAFGEVWLARKMPSGIEKAVKILHKPADDEVAMRELESLELIKNLRHPYLLATEDFWTANNKLYIVTELADSSLRKRLIECKEKGLTGIPEDELFIYTLESAEGFDFLHAKKITHRDVKPDNILIVNGHAKIADFGLARQNLSGEITAVSFAGTPAYMAPEVWSCEGGPPSDQYGFAMSYVELRQGRTPFKLGKVMEVMQAHVSGNFEFADFIGEAERAVLLRALAKEPADRYPSCLAFAEELAEAAGRNIRRKTEPVRPLAPAPVVLPPSKPSRKLLIGGAIALVCAVVLGAILFKGKGKDGGDSGTAAKLPAGTKPYADKTIAIAGGGTLPEWIELDDNKEVRFRLVLPDPTGPRVEPFYMLQSKVWQKLYRENSDSNLPVMNVTANDAAAFAARLGGRLPTPVEWDHAAGYFGSAAEDGPYLAASDLKLGISVPVETHGERRPANKFGLVDMAANGREWTCAILPGEGEQPMIVTGAAFPVGQQVILRGRNFTLKKQLTFAIMKNELELPQTQFADVASPYTSFRIVLPLPE